MSLCFLLNVGSSQEPRLFYDVASAGCHGAGPGVGKPLEMSDGSFECSMWS